MTAKLGSAESRYPQATHPQRWNEPTDLDGRYGAIGIDAVAAALRFTGRGGRPADPPPAPRIDERFIELPA